MATILDPDTLERFRTMSPRQAYLLAKEAVYRSGAVSSEDFLDVFEQLVENGILTQEQLDQYADPAQNR
jgi:hypothetical protein